MGIAARLFTWWRNEPLGTALFTRWKGQLVGTDGFGNRYFEERGRVEGRPRRRWVLYKGEVEGSKVPSEWHAWLHWTVTDLPDPRRRRHPWELEHVPNLTGTPLAYRPPGSLAAGATRPRGTGDYEPWRPD